MEEVVRKDIMSVLAAAIEALNARDFPQLVAVSNRTVHNATIYQDEDSVAIAVLVYALGKVAQRFCEQEKTCPVLAPKLKALDGLLSQQKIPEYRDALKDVLGDIAKLDEKLHLYIEEVLEKARLKKGSKLHEHGISIARAAQMLGVSQWDMMTYIGKTSISDDKSTHEDARRRYKDAKRLFE